MHNGQGARYDGSRINHIPQPLEAFHSIKICRNGCMFMLDISDEEKEDFIDENSQSDQADVLQETAPNIQSIGHLAD